MRFSAFFTLFLLTACQSALDKEGYAYDPLETSNRAVFALNQQLDHYLLQPVATAYQTVVPDVAQTGVRNVMGNLEDIASLSNSLLQFKFLQSGRLALRVLSNTVFGVGGLFDVATFMEHPKIQEDFGATLQHYGFASGPFVMLPLLGPSTVRDGFGRLVDSALTDPLAYTVNWNTRLGISVTEKLQQRADLLGKEGLVNASPDPYATLRDAWLQHRFGQLGFTLEEPDFDEESSQPATETPQ